MPRGDMVDIGPEGYRFFLTPEQASEIELVKHELVARNEAGEMLAAVMAQIFWLADGTVACRCNVIPEARARVINKVLTSDYVGALEVEIPREDR